MAIRNFWIDGYVDGRETAVTGGPRRKDGGMDIDISMRDEGCIVRACRIKCWEQDGTLIVDIFDDNGELIYSKTTSR